MHVSSTKAPKPAQFKSSFTFSQDRGTNGGGQLGVDGVTDTFIARPVPSLRAARAVVAGHEHTCALHTDATVSCWGANGVGQLGDGTTSARTMAAPVMNLEEVQSLTAEGSHSCALRADGELWCWGFNSRGQLGDGSRTSALRPVRVARP